MFSTQDLAPQIDQALKDPLNEPLNWLLGNGLRSHTAWPESPHLLLSELARPRTPTLAFWNAMIAEFRSFIHNPDSAPDKAMKDVQSSGSDADSKLQALATEILAALELRKRGFKEFEIVPTSSVPMPDFVATFNCNEVKIEVKNLEEPTDHVNSVAGDQWRKRRSEDKTTYSFHAKLTHHHRRPLTPAAQSRLRNIIDLFSDAKKPVKETLDGGVDIILERFDGTSSELDSFLFNRICKGAESGRLIIENSWGEEIFEPDQPAHQAFFLKAVRVIVNAQSKFFGQGTIKKDAPSLIALGWAPPSMLWDAPMVEDFEARIKQLYAAFGLELKVVVFQPSRVELSPEFLAKYE